VADDAAGAVRRTPHDELVKLLDESHDTAAGWHPWNFGHGADAILAAGWRPPLAEVMHDAGETAEEAVRRLAAEVVGLRQQLAAVDDALHGLDSDLGDDAPLGARVSELHESYLDMIQVDGFHLDEVRQRTAERDLAVWLHAELQHKLTLPCGDCHPCNNWSDETWRRAGRKPPAVVTWEDKLAETRGLYARLDDAIKLIEEMAGHLRQDAALTIGVETRLAALRGDQPAEPEVTPPWFVVRHCCEAGAVEYPKPCPWHAAPAEPESRCMNGPAKQHTLRVVEVIKALRAASADGVLPGELDDLDSFAQLARAIVDHWPTGEADRG
jgi:hypothetical protein